jgi:hypothetical protein
VPGSTLTGLPANSKAVAGKDTFKIGAKPVAAIFHEIAGPRAGNKVIDLLAHHYGSFLRPTRNKKPKPEKRSSPNVA